MDGHTVQEINAGANACSVEWCPIDNLQSYVACSTYLLKSPQKQFHPSPSTFSTNREIGVDVPEDEHGPVDGMAAEQKTQEVMAADGRQTRTGTVVVHRVSERAIWLLGHNC